MASDWTPVVLKKEMKAKPKSELALHQAKQKGQVEVQARGPSQAASAAAAKLDNAEVGEYKAPTITLEFKLALQKARQAKGLSQADLAKMINQTQKLIQDYESGKAVPQGPIINLLNRKLETVLPKIPKPKKQPNAFDD